VIARREKRGRVGASERDRERAETRERAKDMELEKKREDESKGREKGKRARCRQREKKRRETMRKACTRTSMSLAASSLVKNSFQLNKLRKYSFPFFMRSDSLCGWTELRVNSQLSTLS